MKLNLWNPAKNLKINKASWEMAVKNYEINTKEAITLSKQKNVNEFYIVSLFRERDILEKEKSNFNYLYDKVIYNLEEIVLNQKQKFGYLTNLLIGYKMFFV